MSLISGLLIACSSGERQPPAAVAAPAPRASHTLAATRPPPAVASDPPPPATSNQPPPATSNPPPPVNPTAPPVAAGSSPAPRALVPRAAGRRIALDPEAAALTLPAGRWVVEVAVPAGHYVTLGLAGARDALITFEVLGRRSLKRLRTGSIRDDGQLPTFVSFQSRTDVHHVLAVVDVRAPVRLLRHTVGADQIEAPSAKLLKSGEASARPLIGLPFPVESHAGYRLVTPPRYAFVRTDVAAALRAAFRQTRIRYRRNNIGVGDTSQWDGDRPAQDIDKPRHISHQGGRDVDIGLPTREGNLSAIKRRCGGVMVEEGRLECGPGTVRDFDAARTAYLLGLLIDGPTPGGRFIGKAERRPGPLSEVEVIFTDQSYIDAIRKALPRLRQRRWIHDEAFGALGEEGLLRASPWHTDHIHIRFKGESAAVPALWQNVRSTPHVSDEKKP